MSLSLPLTEYYSSLPRVVAVGRAGHQLALHMALPSRRSSSYLVPETAYLSVSPGDGLGLLSLIVWAHRPDADGNCGALLFTATVSEHDAQTRLALGW